MCLCDLRELRGRSRRPCQRKLVRQAWPQFRGNARLTGVATEVPATLSLKWTYEGGAETFESSPAIADGVVYIGAGNGDLLAIDLETGKLRWKYATGNLLGESSPAVGGGLVYIGDLSGIVHAVNTKDGSKAWTFKTGSEIKSSPVIVGERVVIGSYDTHLYALERQTGKVAWKLKTDGQVHATPTVVNGIIYFGGCDERFRAVRATDGVVLFQVPLDANTGSSAVIEGNRAYLGTFNNEVVAIDLAAKKIAWRYKDPDREFPYYSSPALAGGKVYHRRPRQGDPRDRRGDRQGGVEGRDARARRLVAGGVRRARLRRIERRQALRARRADGREEVGVRGRRRADLVAGDRRRPRRDWRPGRAALLLRVRRADGCSTKSQSHEGTKPIRSS